MNDATDGDVVKIITVKSRLSLLAGGGNGKGKSAAALIAAADRFIQSERGRFLEWATGDLAALEDVLARLHDCKGRDAALAETAYRKTSQIRDLGGTFGYPRITEIADSLCELLYRLRQAGLYSRDAIAMHEAALRLVCTTAAQPADAAVQELLNGLRRIVEKYPQPKAADAGPAAAPHSLSGAQ
jgi:hypothetical protein